MNFKKIKGGTYRFITDVKGELVKFIYEASPTEIYEIEKDSEGYIAQRKKIALETRLAKVVGEIHSSLFEAMDAAGEQDPLTIAFAEILAWEIDFYKDVREGDRFKVVVEKIYKGDQFIQYGAIHAVEYQRGEKIIRGIRYKEGYYNEKGISLRKAFLKAPLRFNRISSKFSQARKHPILGGVRPHLWRGLCGSTRNTDMGRGRWDRDLLWMERWIREPGDPPPYERLYDLLWSSFWFRPWNQKRSKGETETDHRICGIYRSLHRTSFGLPVGQGWPIQKSFERDFSHRPSYRKRGDGNISAEKG